MSPQEVMDLTGHRPAEGPAPAGGGGAGDPNHPAEGPASSGQPSAAGAAQPPASGQPGTVEIEPGVVVQLPPEIADSIAGLGTETPPDGGAAASAAAGAAAGGVVVPDDATLKANITKMLKPTGSETPEQVEANATRLLTEKEKFIGGQAEKLGTVRKIAENLTKTYGQLFEADAEGQPTRLSLKKVSETLGQDEVQRQLAEAGMKLVPIHAASGDEGVATLRVIREQVADTLIPGKELTPAQKLQTLKTQMETDPELKDSFDEKVNAARFEHQLAAAAKVQAEKADQEREQARIAKESDTALEAFEKLPHKETLRPVMVGWAKKLDGKPIVGALRVEVLRRLAEADTLKTRIHQLFKAGFLAGKQHQQGVASGTLPGGGAPAVISGGGAGAGSELGISPEAATRGFA